MRDLRGAWRRSAPGRIWRQSAELELMHRAMGFAALGMVTLLPLLVVVAAAAPYRRAGFEEWIVDGMGLSASPAAAVRKLFATPSRVLSTISAVSLGLLAFFGLSFAASVETAYQRIWDLPPAPWHGVWRRAVWLAALTGYLFAEAQSGDVLRTGLAASAVRVPLTLTAGTAFFWWGQVFLLAHRIPARAALTGALCTMAGLVGLRVFSVLVLSPLTVSNALAYGPVGTIVMVQSWLIGVGFVVFGGALVGRQLHHRTEARRAADTGDTADSTGTAGAADSAGLADAARVSDPATASRFAEADAPAVVDAVDSLDAWPDPRWRRGVSRPVGPARRRRGR